MGSSPVHISITIIVFLLAPSCGDVFSFHKKIVNNYYLTNAEGSHFYRIVYKVGHDAYIGRVPDKVIAYGFNDTVLVAKQLDYLGTKTVYIINMKADSDFAEQNAYLMDTVSEAQYEKLWDKRLRVTFRVIDL